jgi:hypothetical protein
MRHQKLAALLLAISVMTAALPASAEVPYKDLGGRADTAAIQYLYDTHCLAFAGSDNFYPDQVLTRGEMAQLLYGSMAGFQQNATWIKNTRNRAESDAVSAMVQRGIMKSDRNGDFQLDAAVSREDFAVAVYNYLKYYQMADVDEKTAAYADEQDISGAALPMVQALHSKNIMNSKDNLFRPKQGITRADAADVVYRLMKSDGTYISHVAIATQAMKSISAEYGSMAAYFNVGTMYWQGDTLVLAVKGGAPKNLVKRLKDDVKPAGSVVLRSTKYSRADYDLLLNRAVRALVKKDGIRDYVGAEPDFAKEQVVLTVRRSVDPTVVENIDKEVGNGVVRIVVTPTLKQQAADTGNVAK